jgi:hypothetical protein
MVLGRQVRVPLEELKQVLLRPVRDVEGCLGRTAGVLPVREDVVGRLDEDVAQELGAEVHDVGQVLVLGQRGRRGRVCDDARLRLDEEPVGDAEAHDAREVAERHADGRRELLERDGGVEGHVRGELEPGDGVDVRRVGGLEANPA